MGKFSELAKHILTDVMLEIPIETRPKLSVETWDRLVEHIAAIILDEVEKK